MQTYRYAALDSLGKPVSGKIEATGPEDARVRLTRIGLSVTDLAQGAEANVLVPVAVSEAPLQLTRPEVHQVSGHVAEIAGAGLPLAGGLRALAQEMATGRLRRGLIQIASKLESCVDLETALNEHGAPADLCSMIRTGERLGNTQRILHEYTLRLQNAADLRNLIRIALAYPVLLFAFDFAFLAFLFAYLVPQFKKLFLDFGTELPALTKFLIFVSDLILVESVWVTTMVFVVALIVLVLLGTAVGRSKWRRAIYWIPLFGRVMQYASLSGYGHLLAFLVGQKVPLPEALVLTGNGIGDADLRETSRRLAESVSRGEALEETAFRARRFPPMFVQALGHERNPEALSRALHGVADLLQYQSKMQASLTFRLAEPLLMTLTAVTLFFTVVAIFVPLIKLLNDLS